MIPLRPRRATTFALALSLSAVTAGGARAQSPTITIAVGGTASSASVGPNHVFVVPLVADMSAAGGRNLASLTSKMTWTVGRVKLDSIRGAALPNVASTIGNGTATVSVFDAAGVTVTDTIANLYFTAGPNTVGSRIQITPTLAGTDIGVSITKLIRVRNFDVCVAPQLPWGDANGDGEVNIIDAQQIARFTTGLPIANPAAMSSADVNTDGQVTIVDAQQTAAFSIGLSITDPHSRLGTAASDVPEITSISIQPTALDVGVGQAVQLLATPKDANNVELIGCTPVGWSSGNASAASIDVNGVVAGVATGSSTITATATAVTGVSGTLSVSVSEPVDHIDLTPSGDTIHIGEVRALTAIAKAASNTTLPAPVTFETSDPSVATVSSGGQVTAINIGPVTITATSQGKTAITTMQIAPLAENSLATGDDFSCALSVAGAAYCWGSDSTFQLGDGRTTNRLTPVAVAVPSTLRFTQIIAGAKGVCALASTQAVYCWGSKFPGGAFVNPSLASDTLHVKAIAGWGAGDTGGLCMLNVAGTVYCVGDGDRGQMGTGSLAQNSSPKPVSGGTTFQSISSGLHAVCGLSSRSAYCWGSNQNGSLGRNLPVQTPITETATPAPVSGGYEFTSLVVGRTLTCATTADGIAYCWGAGFYGGDAAGGANQSSAPQPNPTQITQGALRFKTVWGQTGTRDLSGSCGLTTDSTAYCWGANNSGQVGTSTTLPAVCNTGTGPNFRCATSPVAVTTTAKFTTLRPGGEHVCGISADHRVLCWGNNASGQLGNNSTTNSSTPVVVQWSFPRVP